MSIPVLETERLVLRPWRPDDERDGRAAYDLYRRPEVARWLGATPRPDTDVEVSRRRLQRFDEVSADGPSGLGLWAIALDDVAIGTALLLRLPDGEGVPTDDVEIGWHLHPDHWGHGYATEAARALVEHGFTSLNLEEIHAVAWAGNDPSFAVMRRLGMERQCETDRWYGVTLDWWLLRRP